MKTYVFLATFLAWLTLAGSAQAAPFVLDLNFDQSSTQNKSSYTSGGLLTGSLSFDLTKAVSTVDMVQKMRDEYGTVFSKPTTYYEYTFLRKDINFALGTASLQDVVNSVPTAQTALAKLYVQTDADKIIYYYSFTDNVSGDGPNANYTHGQSWNIYEFLSYTTQLHDPDPNTAYDPNYYYNGQATLSYKNSAQFDDPNWFGTTVHVFADSELTGKDTWIYPSGYHEGGISITVTDGTYREIYMDAPVPAPTPLPAAGLLLAGALLPVMARRRAG